MDVHFGRIWYTFLGFYRAITPRCRSALCLVVIEYGFFLVTRQRASSHFSDKAIIAQIFHFEIAKLAKLSFVKFFFCVAVVGETWEEARCRVTKKTHILFLYWYNFCNRLAPIRGLSQSKKTNTHAHPSPSYDQNYSKTTATTLHFQGWSAAFPLVFIRLWHAVK